MTPPAPSDATALHYPRIAGPAERSAHGWPRLNRNRFEMRRPLGLTPIPRSASQSTEEEIGSPSRTRTYDKAINSRLLYQLSYRGPRRGLYTRLWRDARPLRIFVGFVYGLATVWPPVAESPLRMGPGLCKRPVTPDRPSDPVAPFPHRWDVREASWRSGYAEDCKSLPPRFDSGRGLQFLSRWATVRRRRPAMADLPHPVASVHPNERVTALPQAA